VDALQALDFVRQHGIVLASGKGPVLNLVEVIAGEPVHGSWWGHSRGREIFRVLQSLRQSNDILVCRLIGGKITFAPPALAGIGESRGHFYGQTTGTGT
jgi:hypothetical protein